MIQDIAILVSVMMFFSLGWWCGSYFKPAEYPDRRVEMELAARWGESVETIVNAHNLVGQPVTEELAALEERSIQMIANWLELNPTYSLRSTPDSKRQVNVWALIKSEDW